MSWEGDTDYEGDISDKSAPEISTFKRRTQGRPPTTGAHYVKQEHDKLVKESKEKEMIDEIMGNNVTAKGTKSMNAMRQAHEIANDFRNAPPADISSRVFESMETIRKVAEKSSNIKGDLKNIMRKAANMAEGAIVEMHKRYMEGQKEEGEAIKDIRNELQALRWENDKLKNEVDRLKKREMSMVEVAAAPERELIIMPSTSQGHIPQQISHVPELGSSRPVRTAAAIAADKITQVRHEENEGEESVTEVDMVEVGEREVELPSPSTSTP